MGEQYYVYIMTNKHNTVLYTGMTGDLKRRAYEHRTGRGGGFTSLYNAGKLVYYEVRAMRRRPSPARSRSRPARARTRSTWSKA
jgi:predicted GIY-YIG superfamily endonuclease